MNSLFIQHHDARAWGHSFHDFVFQVLVPQAATLLIADDLGIDETFARELKDDSTNYGHQTYLYNE